MRIYFRLFNFCACNFGAFYSTKYQRWYVQLIPCVLCLVVVVGNRRNYFNRILDNQLDHEFFGDQP